MSRLLLRGATVVDGTGAPGRAADVLVVGDRIVEVGDPGTVTAAREVDLEGLVLAPGFIDSHTHYDAQILWDPDLTPSSWHGITSVVMGNCGYSVAPARPAAHELLVLTLEAVEGMSRDALRAGIEWTFETYPEYLAAATARPMRLNIGGMLGHTALRYEVLGEEAADRAATEEEVARMAAILREAIDGGALGFSTSQGSVDNGAHGKPVPSRLADRSELLALMDVLAAAGRGVVQLLPGNLRDVPAASRDLAELAARSGRTVTFSAVMSGLFGGPGAALAALDAFAAAGGERVVPQMACRPIVQQVNLRDPFALTIFSEAFVEILGVQPGDREVVYASPEWRRRVHDGATAMVARLGRATVAETEVHAALIGRTLADLAAERGSTPLDVLIDLSLDERIETRFTVPIVNDDEDEVGELLRDPRCLLSLSDAGAHQSQICDAVFSTYLLGHWVRDKQVIPLEFAVWRLTGHPAKVFGLADRGVIRPGAFADLVAFDPATVAAGPLRRVHDLPAGGDRLIADAHGIEHVWVNGIAIVDGGRETDARPGTLLQN